MKIETIQKREEPTLTVLLAVWEDSVLATHDFLPDEAVNELRPLVYLGLAAIPQLITVKDEQGLWLAFLGAAEDKIEMLFVASTARGMGLGKMLITHAVNELGCQLVDVNEQNQQAVGFYEKMGFEVFERSALDGQGNPYPILHMRYRQR